MVTLDTSSQVRARIRSFVFARLNDIQVAAMVDKDGISAVKTVEIIHTYIQQLTSSIREKRIMD